MKTNQLFGIFPFHKMFTLVVEIWIIKFNIWILNLTFSNLQPVRCFLEQFKPLKFSILECRRPIFTFKILNFSVPNSCFVFKSSCRNAERLTRLCSKRTRSLWGKIKNETPVRPNQLLGFPMDDHLFDVVQSTNDGYGRNLAGIHTKSVTVNIGHPEKFVKRFASQSK